jgi:hypothetical protein
MKSSQRLIDYLKKTEGYSGVAYKCPAGVWTIGYGHTNGVKPGDKIKLFSREYEIVSFGGNEQSPEVKLVDSLTKAESVISGSGKKQ